MLVAIKSRGGGALIRIPKSIMQAAGLKISDVVDISAIGDQIVLTRPSVEESEAREEAGLLAMLIAGGQSDDRHEDISFGPPVGKEILYS